LPVGKDRTEGGDGGYRYAKTFDPFVPMTAAAAATTTLKVATGVCLVPQRDPIHTAKEVATVDVLFDGRVILGVGAGWNRQEMRNQQDAGQSGGRHDDEREPNGVPCSAPPSKGTRIEGQITAGSGSAIASTPREIRWGRGSLSVAPSSGSPTGGRRVVL
jgi:hypothetical protein